MAGSYLDGGKVANLSSSLSHWLREKILENTERPKKASAQQRDRLARPWEIWAKHRAWQQQI